MRSNRFENAPRIWKAAILAMAFLASIGVVEVACRLAGGLWDSVDRHVEQGRPLATIGLKNVGAEELPTTITSKLADNTFWVPDAELLYRVKPNPSGDPIGGYTNINAEGFRGRLFSRRPKPAGSKRIMILGDSCAFGWGIKDYSQTFAVVMEQRLLSRGVTPEVLNFGQPGHSTAQNRILFRRWFRPVSPDYLVLYSGWNDLWETPLLRDIEILTLAHWMNRPVMRGLMSTGIYRLLARMARTNWLGLRPPELRVGVATHRVRVPIDEALANVDEFLSSAAQIGTRVVFIPAPFRQGAEAECSGMIEYNKAMLSHLKGRARALLLPEMEHSNPASPSYFVDAVHPNEKGAMYLAERLTELVRQWELE